MEPEDDNSELLERGTPLWTGDVNAEFSISYRTTVLCLEDALRRRFGTDGVQWLQLVLEGHSGRAAARKLGHGWHWLAQVITVCADAVYD